MAEPVEETLEGASVKRKSDLELVDGDDNRKKMIKPEISDTDPQIVEDKTSKDDSESEADVENDEDEYDDDDDDDDDDEHSNGKSVIDTNKGKGILRVEDKGKGKLKVENGSEDDSSDDGDLSEEDCYLSDDPLAEVDLDNILPVRTRRRVAQPGAYIVNDLEDDDGDDSDDDSDA